MLLKYLFSVAENNYLALKKYFFKKYVQTYVSMVLFWSSYHKKDNSAIEIQFECMV
jgi:hypothetical protein